ncbi:MAG: M48 family metalloprotease, partial [Gammaproteobacteria bacterium]|nr:M48 family metalloprotease [Gammaproteobacteria bacterium]NIR98882.1 M48 family metalloprotease [Gammaproteobacteria bacterium]NIT64003.1 M48 family metalloprotease [Gammaproteobacteria bacterium]NIX10332.1 M48 family metalloprotease [Gammaproteobacteria bacterium]NIY32583.1 M48 family metalloprotease [Gammaproteobacteria bacterium]
MHPLHNAACRRLPGRIRGAVLAAALLASAPGCGVNPVTGERELQLVSRAAEIQIGEENYLYTRQAQGGMYKLDPALGTYVSMVGQRLAKVSDRPDLPYEFVVVNNSTPNAWALPGGKIAVNRGLLLELDNEAELAAVLGHEIVHAAARHGAKRIERGTLLQLGVVALGAAVAESRHAEHTDLVVGAAALGSQLIDSRYSRGAELEADRYGMTYMARAGYDLRAAIKLQETFVRLAEGREHSWLEGLFASHPPSPERVAANRGTAASLPAAGRLGAEEYRARIEPLVASRGAYGHYEKGRRALAEGREQEALAQAGKAIADEPREALFYALKGDVRLRQRRYREAIAEYDRALARNDRFFYHYRQRGLARDRLGDRAKANADLRRSVALLPTAAAHHLLGDHAREAGRAGEAIEHYRKAANTRTESGRQAYRELVRLDLPRNPGTYLAVQAGAQDGRIALRIQNRSAVALSDITVQVTG